jgi:methyltransferase (TIGR00027 family)
MHVLVDPPPHVLEDEIGLQLIAPDATWRDRPDMDPEATSGIRAGIVARARLVEDLIADQAERGVRQYVLLGAGLDSFAQRRAELASRLHVFEVDRPGPQVWKRQRLQELGFGVPEWLHFVPDDFETSGSWRQGLADAGFAADQPAVIASTGVTMYLTREANAAMLQHIAALASGSTLAATFLLPADLIDDPRSRTTLRTSQAGARTSGTPFVSFFAPADLMALARDAGFRHVEHISGARITERYFANRTDGLRPARGEEFLIAST